MNTRPEVDYGADNDSAWTAAVREREQAQDAIEGKREASSPAPDGHEQADRVSVDPLRATDRYRLVAPLDLRI